MTKIQELGRLKELYRVVGNIAYKDWHFYVVADGDFGYLQLQWMGKDNDTDVTQRQYGRKWRLCPYMTDSEVVQTAFLAVKTAEEHETRELFTFKGARIFGPHIDVEVLIYISNRIDIRAAV